jgi:hypothetical protein
MPDTNNDADDPKWLVRARQYAMDTMLFIGAASTVVAAISGIATFLVAHQLGQSVSRAILESARVNWPLTIPIALISPPVLFIYLLPRKPPLSLKLLFRLYTWAFVCTYLVAPLCLISGFLLTAYWPSPGYHLHFVSTIVFCSFAFTMNTSCMSVLSMAAPCLLDATISDSSTALIPTASSVSSER